MLGHKPLGRRRAHSGKAIVQPSDRRSTDGPIKARNHTLSAVQRVRQTDHLRPVSALHISHEFDKLANNP